MNKSIKEIKLAAFRYWFEDGLSEIVVGTLFLLIGLLIQAETLILPGSFLAGTSGLASFILVVVGVWLARRVIRSLKERLTYPRTGYVDYHKGHPVPRVLTPVIGAFIAAILVWLIKTYPQTSPVWIPLFQGIVLAIFLLVIGLRSGLVRFHILALITLLFSLGLSQLTNRETVTVGITFAAFGLGLTLSGLIALRRYLQGTRAQQEVIHGE